MTGAPLVAGLSALASHYDAYLLDQFGVLHDGAQAYPGVIDCLEALQAAGKQVIILSNSGTRRAPNVERLARLGIPPALYQDLVTSGEVTRQFLAAAPAELGAAPGGGALRCLPLGGTAERAILAGLDVIEVAAAADADFLLMASFGLDPPPRAAFDAPLAEARRRGLTLVCANPDVKGVSARGLIHAPGALAADYAAAGGHVVYIGKPYPLIYRHVLDRLAPLPSARVLAVGDSLAHDIAGAKGVGVAAALVIEGIHEEELGEPADDGFASRLAALQRREGAQPDYLLRRLAW
jgi:HAD superfamily hydrolase (TIGR01459 family)